MKFAVFIVTLATLANGCYHSWGVSTTNNQGNGNNEPDSVGGGGAAGGPGAVPK